MPVNPVYQMIQIGAAPPELKMAGRRRPERTGLPARDR